ncbi:DUF2165 family protein [Photobacterium sp. 53610]|uniref:DUF2165 family protein n=1 Tax=Photobacterium sp. 53610 TaxID=3102789 RepID=UPI002EDBAD4A
MKSFYLFKAAIVTGLAMWLTIAATNNLLDSGTNQFLLSSMFKMEGLIADPVFGNGLESRAIHINGIEKIALSIIILVQYIVSLSLWYASYCYFKAFASKGCEVKAISVTNIALSLFAMIWVCFLCGGLYFGYWLKFSGPQGVHFTLLIISIIAFVMNNIPSLKWEAAHQ